MKKEYVILRLEKAVHLRLLEEKNRMRLVKKFGPMETRFKHDFSLGDVIEYLLDLKDEHRARAKRQKKKRPAQAQAQADERGEP